jgi:hypothetical protein
LTNSQKGYFNQLNQNIKTYHFNNQGPYCQIGQNFNKNEKANQIKHLEKQ